MRCRTAPIGIGVGRMRVISHAAPGYIRCCWVPQDRPVIEVFSAMAGTSGRRIAVMVCAFIALGSSLASASEEAVDRTTQQALELDAHPQRGASVFRESCSRCHGTEAQGDASRAVPALAGQRFKYIVRQLAHLIGAERRARSMQ